MATTTYEQAKKDSLLTFIGTPHEISRKVNNLTAKKVFAVTLNNFSVQETEAFAAAVITIADMVHIARLESERKVFDALLVSIVPSIVPEPKVIREAAMLAHARQAVLKDGNWLTAPQVGNLAGFSTSNLSAQPTKWKKARQIFTIKYKGTEYFPDYGLDPTNDYRPLLAMADVLEAFDDSKDGWGLAYWFASNNSFLGGKRPKDLLATQTELVVAAAHDELEGIVHG